MCCSHYCHTQSQPLHCWPCVYPRLDGPIANSAPIIVIIFFALAARTSSHLAIYNRTNDDKHVHLMEGVYVCERERMREFECERKRARRGPFGSSVAATSGQYTDTTETSL